MFERLSQCYAHPICKEKGVTMMRSAFLLAALGGMLALNASAEITVLGDGEAHACAVAAHLVSRGAKPDPRYIAACNTALNFENLSLRDLAGTRVNRGVILLATLDYAAALRDFNAATGLMPNVGEAYTDRGAALIGLGRYAEGITEIDKGLTFNPGEPEKAYYNRALAYEALDDLKSAYRDFTHASELKPDWAQVQEQLARYTVVAQAKS
jgi:tetratricopeptide (TPR) repeat protein